MKRRVWIALVACAAAASCRRAPAPSAPGSTRIVSLAPDVTETLFEIGAGPKLVAVSDYCDAPAAAAALPHVGTSITPNYEAIARLSPTLIVSEANVSARRRELSALGRTELLPWLSLAEIAGSVRRLGELTHTEATANALAQRLLRELDVPEPAHGPRVLLVLGGESADTTDIWFIRNNSLHGAALRAAGARNALSEDVSGPPRITFEKLLALDPDAILVLARPVDKQPSEQARFERFPTLRAVKQKRVSLLYADEAFANGPRILPLVARIRAELTRLGVLP